MDRRLASRSNWAVTASRRTGSPIHSRICLRGQASGQAQVLHLVDDAHAALGHRARHAVAVIQDGTGGQRLVRPNRRGVHAVLLLPRSLRGTRGEIAHVDAGVVGVDHDGALAQARSTPGNLVHGSVQHEEEEVAIVGQAAGRDEAAICASVWSGREAAHQQIHAIADLSSLPVVFLEQGDGPGQHLVVRSVRIAAHVA